MSDPFKSKFKRLENSDRDRRARSGNFRIVYFVKDGDTIWNIARDFRVTMDSIKKVNNLQDDKINRGEKLYIMK